MGVIVCGLEGGWFETGDAQEVVRTVLDVLFWKAYPKKGVGLLGTVRKRYDDAGEAADFNQTAGDGTLWAAMLAAVWKTPWVGFKAGIQKGLAMRAVLTCQDLLSTSSVGRLTALLRGLGPMFTPSEVLDESMRVNLVLTKLEQYSAANWARLHGEQQAMTLFIREGDIHYHREAGWVFTTRQPSNPAKNGFTVYRQNQAEVMVATNGFYLNLSQLSQRDDFIARLLHEADQSPQASHELPI